jgi:glycosyltransferase involved in cell wall biosynthesis
MPVDILIPVRNQYLHFRQLYESIRHLIADNEIGQIIVVDDHSLDRTLRAYTQYLHNRGLITLIRNGIPLPSYYTGIPVPFLKSKGHGTSLNIGLKHVKTDHVFILDPDSIILRGDILKNSVHCFDLDPLIMAVGQVVGQVRGIEVIGSEERKKARLTTEYIQKHSEQYGFTNACCMLVRMSAWNEHGLSLFWDRGWAHMPFVRSIFQNGFETCNFDFFIDGYVIHLGWAELKNMRFKYLRFKRYKEGLPSYGHSLESNKYANKERGEVYSGYFELKIPSTEYDAYLEKTYMHLPFEESAPPVDLSFFGPPNSSKQ